MNLPSKSVSYSESILAKFPMVLRELSMSKISPLALYKIVKAELQDITEYMEVLDCLFVLGKVVFDEELGVLKRVD